MASTIVDLAILQQVVHGMIRHESTDSIAELRRRVEVINVFDVPAYRYSQERRIFVQVTGPRRLFGDANDKAEYLRERFEVHKQKLLRHALFTAPISGDVENAALRVRPPQGHRGQRGRASGSLDWPSGQHWRFVGSDHADSSPGRDARQLHYLWLLGAAQGRRVHAGRR